MEGGREMQETLKIVATPAFMEKAGGGLGSVVPVAHRLAQGGRGSEPSWLVGDPAAKGQGTLEDEGHTLRVPAAFKFWAIRDDHPPGCDCGCEAGPIGGSVVTFLLPEEY